MGEKRHTRTAFAPAVRVEPASRRSDEGDVRMPDKETRLAIQTLRTREIIAIEPGNISASRGLETGIARGRDAAIDRVADDADRLCAGGGFRLIGRGVRGAVVDDDYLHILERLPGEARHRLSNDGLAVEYRNDHRHSWRIHADTPQGQGRTRLWRDLMTGAWREDEFAERCRYFLPNSRSISAWPSFTHVGRPWLHWPERGVTSISRSKAFISATESTRPARTEP